MDGIPRLEFGHSETPALITPISAEGWQGPGYNNGTLRQRSGQLARKFQNDRPRRTALGIMSHLRWPLVQPTGEVGERGEVAEVIPRLESSMRVREAAEGGAPGAVASVWVRDP